MLNVVWNSSRSIALLICCSALVGCGSGKKPHHDVHGKVTLNGQPVVYGSLTFSPASNEANPGRTMIVQVRENGYDLRPNGGAVAGPANISLTHYPVNFTPKDWDNLTEVESLKLGLVVPKLYTKKIDVNKDELNLEFVDADLDAATPSAP